MTAPADLVDSHLHLDDFERDGSLADVLARARDAGVRHLVAIGGTDEANARAVRLAAAQPDFLSATVGYDRDEAGHVRDAGGLRALLDLPHVVGVGETGLDYHYAPETAAAQRDLFEGMLDLAREAAKPVVVHSREADDDTQALLQAHARAWPGPADRLGVLHCFTGTLAFARRLVDLGYYISLSGILTFKKAEALREVGRWAPADRLLIETDAPYLAPVPHRGQRNEPAWVIEIAAALATIRNTGLQDMAEQTARNARRLFGIGKDKA